MPYSLVFIKVVSVLATIVMCICYFKVNRLMTVLSQELKSKWNLLLYMIYFLTAIYFFITIIILYSEDITVVFHIFPWILLLGAAFIYVFSDALLEMREEGKTVIHLVTPTHGKVIQKTKTKEIKAGTTYIVEEEKKQRSFKLFADLIDRNMKGLCITRSNPQEIREKYLPMTVPILWLTEVKSEQSIAPSLEEIAHKIQEFITKNEGQTVIFFDGVEYLSQTASFNLVLQLIDRLKDVIAVSKGRLIISLNPITFSEKELSLLEKNAELV
ncbi:MAG: DUF835 domain-containing protein [Candidatus Altiarchaeota archaeon]